MRAGSGVGRDVPQPVDLYHEAAVTLLLVVVGAAVGAPLRYLTDRAEDGARRYAALNAAISVAAGLGAAFLGWVLAGAIWV
jgi:fluoride ion exporter CrcB/FEX